VGLLLFSDQVEHYVPPGKGRGHVHRILRDLFYFQPKSRRTKISEGLSYLQGVLKKRAAIFVLSDFFDEGFDQSLRLLGRKHDVSAIVVQDHAELHLPNLGVVELQDSENGDILTVDTGSLAFREEFAQAVKKKKTLRDRLLKQAQVGRVDVNSSENYVDPLIEFFRRKHRR
jgi:uncharacterized protein (DUF58 family)